MQARPVMIGRKRQRRHRRAEIGAADADIDHIGELGAAGRGDRSRAKPRGEGRHALQHVIDRRHDVFPVHMDGLVRTIAQGDMQHGAVFRRIDRRARKHGIALAGNVGRCGQQLQQLHRALADIAFRPVQKESVQLRRKMLKALGILRESRAHVPRRFFGPMQPERVQHAFHIAALPDGLSHGSAS